MNLGLAKHTVRLYFRLLVYYPIIFVKCVYQKQSKTYRLATTHVLQTTTTDRQTNKRDIV